MLQQMPDMPAGTVGFEAFGKVEDDDFERSVEPVLRGEIAAGHKIRLLYLLGPGMREYEGDTLGEEMKFAARHPTSYEPSQHPGHADQSGLPGAGAALGPAGCS